MTILGIKLTHDGGFALLDDNRLVFSYEVEKLKNGARYSVFNLELSEVDEILGRYGYSINKIDRFVIDGWTPDEPVTINLGRGEVPVKLAEYGSFISRQDVMERKLFALPGDIKLNYSSYRHVAGHIAAAYSTSPFAKAKEDAYVLVWDGGMFPQLFFYNYATNKVDNLGLLFLLVGNIYSIFSQHFGPFKVNKEKVDDVLSVAGKVMAYIALGKFRKELIPIFKTIYDSIAEKDMNFANIFSKEFLKKIEAFNYPDEDILQTFHVYIENLLVERLISQVHKRGQRSRNLCFVGGCALNIKWNSALRNAGMFDSVWVPPFPNDAGSALGTACCELINATGINQLDWDVYSGPPVLNNFHDNSWKERTATIKDLARLLFEENEPVVFLNGNAELGPRALGNRSILAPANHKAMKQVLNRVKLREDYRPVAPICLEEDAKDIFDPGTRDPYMLFDHLVKKEWLDRVPAICHLDGTARLQTVSETDNPVVYSLLQEYKKLSGIPLLCNTSANYKGKGFFPDVASAIDWNEVNYVWSGGVLYEKLNKIQFKESRQLIKNY